MTVLDVVQLLTFVVALALVVYAAVAPRDANPEKRRRRTRLYSGWAMVGVAAFFAARAADELGWSRYLLGAVALAALAYGASLIAKNRSPQK